MALQPDSTGFADVVQANAQLDKHKMLLNMLTARYGSLENLADLLGDIDGLDKQTSEAKVNKLREDYEEILEQLQGRIAQLVDVVHRAKAFRDVYESCISWLATAQRQFDHLPYAAAAYHAEPSTIYQRQLQDLQVYLLASELVYLTRFVNWVRLK